MMDREKAWSVIEWASMVLAIDEKGTNGTLSKDLIKAAKALEALPAPQEARNE